MFNNIAFSSIKHILSFIFDPCNTVNYSLSSIKRVAYRLNFSQHGLIVLRRIALFFLDSASTEKKCVPKTKIVDVKVYGLALSTSADNTSNWCNPCTSVKRCWLFAPSLSVTDTPRFIMKLQANNKNYSGSPLSNNTILNSLRSYFSNVRSLHHFI